MTCPLCYATLGTCARCGREHCVAGPRQTGCAVLTRCDNPPVRRDHDPLRAAPYGFQIIERTGFAGGRGHE